MTKECFLECPELFEGPDDDNGGIFGPYGDTGLDSDTPLEELDPEIVAASAAYLSRRVEVIDNLNANHQVCIGAQVVYDIRTRKPFLVCPITSEPYRMPLEVE